MFAFTSLGWHRHDQTTRPPTALPALPLPCGADVTGRVPAWSGGLRTVGLAVASMALKTRSRVVRKGRSASSPETPRRCALMSTMAVLCPGTLGAGQRASAKGNPFVLLQDGMEAFRNYKVEDSIKFFDEAAESGYPKARLWQRGLSLYYAERFEEGTQQFRKDVEVNPNDTEESLWAFLCEARMVGFEQARKQMMTVGFDPRPVMGSVYALYKGDDDAKYVARLEELYQKGGSDAFYASLYLGLYYEAKADTESAKLWLLRSVESKYGQSSNDYMADLARVHVARRQWRAEL
ncbi:unnamed protein product [Durusdinium trenchii]|uniref:Uncharacterized protein n=2 Tax=Durusdinium trenchii TaxID=1381693 RepID=A0ABP0JSU3_9DINO